MKKLRCPKEVLSLIFIISTMVLIGKVLFDVKSVISLKINQLMPQPKISVEYQAYSLKNDSAINDIDSLNVIESIDDLNKLKETIKSKKIEINWLNKKLKLYKEDFFDNKTLVVIFLTNDNNVSLTKINSITKKNNYITVGITKKLKEAEVTSQYTWLTIIEIDEINNNILLDITYA